MTAQPSNSDFLGSDWMTVRGSISPISWMDEATCLYLRVLSVLNCTPKVGHPSKL